MMALFWLVFGAGLGALAIAAGLTLRARRRLWSDEALPKLDDEMIEQIIEQGAVYVEEDEPLDLREIDDEEKRFWSESWDEPSEEW